MARKLLKSWTCKSMWVFQQWIRMCLCVSVIHFLVEQLSTKRLIIIVYMWYGARATSRTMLNLQAHTIPAEIYNISSANVSFVVSFSKDLWTTVTQSRLILCQINGQDCAINHLLALFRLTRFGNLNPVQNKCIMTGQVLS